MYIDNVILNGIDYKFHDLDNNHHNRSTIIVGENASGKSELLREIIGAIIRAKLGKKEYHSPYVDILDEHLSESYKHNIRQSIKDVDITVNIFDGFKNSFHYNSYSSKRTVTNYKGEKVTLSDGVFRNKFNAKTGNTIEYTPNIIAISSTSYDKFPRIKDNRVMGNSFYVCFTSHQIDYSSFETDRFNIRSSNYNLNHQVSNFCESLFLSISKDRILMLKGVFSWLSFSSKFKVIYSFNNKINQLNIDKLSNQAEKNAYAYYQSNTSKSDLPFIDNIDSNREMEFDFNHLSRENINLIELSKLECITFHNVEFINNKNANSIMLSTLSSGQLSLIYGLIGLLSRIEDNSLIFIDEPEVSLHPKWQEVVLKKYKEIIDSFEKCHLIVATHSPQVASSLDCDNSFILRMKDSKLIPCNEIKNRSVDFQLADIFEAPNFSNDYISTELVKVLTLISKNGEINNELRDRIGKLKSYRGNLKDTDPLHKMYKLLNSLEERLSDSE
ncbi:TPA: AAA family ATPase [Vibrio parahaemolyticus]|uniref:AAA family ATPase n=1 Tax=Vibrio parahaemolyticus TaxID=670 RepID=UPI00111EAB62|nr:AAA family ATPase [Vibrio parahaemolyticus]MDF4359116.1 AAA family ATPase [Vibrio parahaemolyticus]MDF4541488.1 AAA family ATPase [Vibrio parahaemolyticus]MDG2576607.1 AAA family ATPase [Vibrio parahaemolyticus]MDG2796716.1 AAA family ATPase [Vibrio parahaemolyticus]MEA5263812.1 AAA family ATPase [Vibrio parahaemolyticus]